jgi:N-acetylglucosamine malate deacetylase 1
MATILFALSHPDDEVVCAGTIAVHAARGDRVVLLWLSRGTMTQAFAGETEAAVARIRTEHAEQAARILGAEPRFLEFPDTAIETGPDSARIVALVIAEVQPDAVVTWGDAWISGLRHPDHQATGKIARDAITLARIGRIVAPREPHRAPAPVFTLRDRHSSLPELAIDVTSQVDAVRELGRFYYDRVGWPGKEWLNERLSREGARFGVPAVELFDAWETAPGLHRYLVENEGAHGTRQTG